jgi:chromosome condensin MukBEF complex kleisin-like MukF subunit
VNTTEQHLKRIQDKLQQLLKQHSVLQKENQLLREELDILRNQTEKYNAAADKLKQQVEILQYTNGEMEDEEKKQFEKRINGYLKEIDRCITMLSS